MYLPNDDHLIGTLTFYKMLLSKENNAQIYSEQHGYNLEADDMPMARYVGKENEDKAVSKIYIKEIKAFKKNEYKDIKTALIQIAIETSIQAGAEGRVMLTAAKDSSRFYDKMGLIPFNGGSEEETTQETRDYSGLLMCLPNKGIQTWNEKIEQSPILFKE